MILRRFVRNSKIPEELFHSQDDRYCVANVAVNQATVRDVVEIAPNHVSGSNTKTDRPPSIVAEAVNGNGEQPHYSTEIGSNHLRVKLGPFHNTVAITTRVCVCTFGRSVMITQLFHVGGKFSLTHRRDPVFNLVY